MFHKKLLLIAIPAVLLIGTYFLKQDFLTKSKVSVSESISYKCQPNRSAFDLLIENTKSISTKDTSFGKQIIAINEIEQNNGKYWLYSVGGKEATVSAESYTCQDNEEVKWELK